jgi:beta-lactamase regulating signal transducer with metallopeptidase domain
MDIKKIAAIVLIVVLVFNIVFRVMGKIDDLVFWLIILVCFLGSYGVKKLK